MEFITLTVMALEDFRLRFTLTNHTLRTLTGSVTLGRPDYKSIKDLVSRNGVACTGRGDLGPFGGHVYSLTEPLAPNEAVVIGVTREPLAPDVPPDSFEPREQSLQPNLRRPGVNELWRSMRVDPRFEVEQENREVWRGRFLPPYPLKAVAQPNSSTPYEFVSHTFTLADEVLELTAMLDPNAK